MKGTAYLVKTGRNHNRELSPNTSWKLLYLPRLKPSLSFPVLNIGGLNASAISWKKKKTSQINDN